MCQGQNVLHHPVLQLALAQREEVLFQNLGVKAKAGQLLRCFFDERAVQCVGVEDGVLDDAFIDLQLQLNLAPVKAFLLLPGKGNLAAKAPFPGGVEILTGFPFP